MTEALDAYQIGDISHNIPFIQDVCRTPRYLDGNICTEYIQEEYPDGFQGVQLTAEEIQQVASAAEYLDKAKRGVDVVVEVENEVISDVLPVELLSANQNLFQMKVGSEVVWVHLLETTTLGYKLGFRGAIVETVVRTPRECELSKFMLPKKVEDTSMFVASPMPGVVASLAVKPGDRVEIGQKLQ